MKYVVCVLSLVFAVSCSSMKNNSSESRADVEDNLQKWVGSATKADLTEKWGKPEWCRTGQTGEETCRFLLERGTVWKGSKKFRKSYTSYDEVVATFGANEALKTYKVRTQR